MARRRIKNSCDTTETYLDECSSIGNSNDDFNDRNEDADYIPSYSRPTSDVENAGDDNSDVNSDVENVNKRSNTYHEKQVAEYCQSGML